MDSIDFLEAGGGDPVIIWQGEPLDLPDPREHHFQWVLMALHARHVPGLPGMPEYKRAAAFEHWRAAWDLPPFADARRLAYNVDHYRRQISHDLLLVGIDLGALWRARRWSTLIDAIDFLPSHSNYAAAVAMDEEHAKLMAEAIAAREAAGESEPSGPSLTSWTPEVATLTRILDAVRHLEYTVAAVQVGKAAGQPPAPSPYPKTALQALTDSARLATRKAKHEALVARLKPKKRPPEDPLH